MKNISWLFQVFSSHYYSTIWKVGCVIHAKNTDTFKIPLRLLNCEHIFSVPFLKLKWAPLLYKI